MKRTREEAIETRDAIIEAALRVCSNRGYRGTTLDEIASEAGLSRGAIHWHFGTKYKLFLYIGKQAADKIVSFLEDVDRTGISTLDILRDMMKKFLCEFFNDRTFRDSVHLAMRARMTNDMDDLKDIYLESVNRRKQFIVSVIRKGMDLGEIRKTADPELLAGAILSYMSGSMNYWIFNSDIFPIENQVDAYVNLFLMGIGTIEVKGNK